MNLQNINSRIMDDLKRFNPVLSQEKPKKACIFLYFYNITPYLFLKKMISYHLSTRYTLKWNKSILCLISYKAT